MINKLKHALSNAVLRESRLPWVAVFTAGLLIFFFGLAVGLVIDGITRCAAYVLYDGWQELIVGVITTSIAGGAAIYAFKVAQQQISVTEKAAEEARTTSWQILIAPAVAPLADLCDRCNWLAKMLEDAPVQISRDIDLNTLMEKIGEIRGQIGTIRTFFKLAPFDKINDTVALVDENLRISISFLQSNSRRINEIDASLDREYRRLQRIEIQLNTPNTEQINRTAANVRTIARNISDIAPLAIVVKNHAQNFIDTRWPSRAR